MKKHELINESKQLLGELKDAHLSLALMLSGGVDIDSPEYKEAKSYARDLRSRRTEIYNELRVLNHATY